MGKANMAPLGDARWHKFESVELPNGDNVGVATAWEKPDRDPVKMAQAEALFLCLLDKLTGQGRTVNPTSGPTFAPTVFAKEKEAREAKMTVKGFKEAMQRLFDQNLIRVEEGRSEGRHPIKCIVRV
jgi:hypothetical protein